MLLGGQGLCCGSSNGLQRFVGEFITYLNVIGYRETIEFTKQVISLTLLI